MDVLLKPFAFILRVSQGGPCSLAIVLFQNCPMFPCSHTLSECFRTVIFRILFPCSQKLANVPLFPSIFCQCSLVPQNPWETLYTLVLRNREIFKSAYTPKCCFIIHCTIFKYHVVTTDHDCIQHRPNIEWVFLPN